MPRNHEVQPGECLASIADEYGFFPDTLWEAPENEPLRALRGDPFVLAPGDVVVIPEKKTTEVPIETGVRHRFRRRGVPERLTLRLFDDGVARANVDYEIEVAGRRLRGRTDAEGRLEQRIPPNATTGWLVLSEHERYELRLGHLDPVSTDAGLRARLVNLEYLPAKSREPAALAEALMAFQARHGLAPTGTADDATRARLQEVHGG
jgi:N-acetylmuramoyl-L-alanine amidase